MTQNPDHISLLWLVDRFSSFARYGGVMPLHLLVTREELVDELVGREMLHSTNGRSLSGRMVEGIALTETGRCLLRESSTSRPLLNSL